MKVNTVSVEDDEEVKEDGKGRQARGSFALRLVDIRVDYLADTRNTSYYS